MWSPFGNNAWSSEKFTYPNEVYLGRADTTR